MPDKQGPNGVVDGCSKRLAGRLETGHCLYLRWTEKQPTANSQMLVVSIPNPDSGTPLQVLPTLEVPAEDSVC